MNPMTWLEWALLSNLGLMFLLFFQLVMATKERIELARRHAEYEKLILKYGPPPGEQR